MKNIIKYMICGILMCFCISLSLAQSPKYKKKSSPKKTVQDNPDKQKAKIQFENPTVPGTLILENYQGNVNIEGYKGKEVLIEAKRKRKTDKSKQDIFFAKEKYNTMLVRTEDNEDDVDYTIKVPEKTSVKLKVQGNVNVSQTSRLVEVDSQEGEVQLDKLEGWAVVNTVDGDIKANFKEVIANKAMSFASLNGGIYLTLPKELNADFRIKSTTGNIYNEFPAFNSLNPNLNQSAATNFYRQDKTLEERAKTNKKILELEKKESKKTSPKPTKNKPTNQPKRSYQSQQTYQYKANKGGAVFLISTRKGKVEVKKK